MIGQLASKLKKWLKDFESVLMDIKQRSVSSASFFDKKVQLLVDDFWKMMQKVYDDDVLTEIKKQGFDVDTADEVPRQVWSVIAPKLDPVLKVFRSDMSKLLKLYKNQLDTLSDDTLGDIDLIKDIKTDEVLIMFNTTLKDKDSD